MNERTIMAVTVIITIFLSIFTIVASRDWLLADIPALLCWSVACLSIGIFFGLLFSGYAKTKSEERIAIETAKVVESEKRKGEIERERMRQEAAEVERKRKEDEIEAEKKRTRDLVLLFTTRQKAILFNAVHEQAVTLKSSDDWILARALEKDGLLEELDIHKSFSRTWRATDFARSVVSREDHELWKNLSDAVVEDSKAEREKRLDQQQEFFLGLPFKQRAFALAVWNKGSVVDNEWEIRGEYDSGFLNDEDMGNGKKKYTIDPHYADLFTERYDECSKTVMEVLGKDEDD